MEKAENLMNKENSESTVDYAGMLNRNSSVNLSKQLEEIFREYINSGEWETDVLIPSEAVLSQRFGVSRATVRTALISLENDKMVYRIKGKGTAVLSKQLNSKLPRAGLREAIYKAGIDNNEKLQILSCKKMKVPDEVAKKLKIPFNDPVLYVERLSVTATSGKPRSFQGIYIPERMADLINLSETKDKVFHKLFEEAGIYTVGTKEWLSVSGTNAYESSVLQVKKNTPTFVIEELRYDQNKNPYYYMKIIRPGGSVKFEFVTEGIE